MNKTLTAGIIGATGYTGRELVSLLARHPRLRIVWATSESEAGAPVPGFRGLAYSSARDVELTGPDIVFSCLPTGQSAEWVLRAREAGARVVDLSADLRPAGAGAGETAGGSATTAVYGLTELRREEVASARLVANPGCYPTGVLLALSPLLAAGVVDTSRPLIVNAASGVTGAGRTPKRELLFGEVAEDYRAYGVGNVHRHVPEIEAGLARAAGGCAPDFVFTPHLLPIRRGILETIYVPLADGGDASDVMSSLDAAYDEEPFIELSSSGLPSLSEVVGRNVVAIGATDVSRVDAPMAICVAALDNLLKGAAGQALQNANLMLGLEETEGVPW